MEEKLKEAYEIIKWFVDNDETNEGEEWEEFNAFWIEGLNRGRKFLEENKEYNS